MVQTLHDGLSRSRPFRPVGRLRTKYPFRVNQDMGSRLVEQDYKCLPEFYVPPLLGGAVTHELFQDYYLLGETDVVVTPVGTGKFTRTYGPIPTEQAISALVPLTRPNGSTVGSLAAVPFGGTASNSAPFTLDLVTSYPPMYAYLGYYIAAGLNLIFGPVLSGCTSANSGANTRVTTTSAHGLDGTQDLVAWNGSISAFSYATTAQYSVVSGTQFDILGHNYGTSINGSFAKTFRKYTVGTDSVDGQLVDSFYLPGVTPGVKIPTDIPKPTPLTNDAALLSAVIANAADEYQHYDIVSREQWMGTPIYKQTTRRVNLFKL